MLLLLQVPQNRVQYWWQLSLQNIRITSHYRYLRQGCSLHESVISAGPSSLQSFPPCCGAGLVQVLVLVITPPPHVALHSDSFHSVYLPSIAKPLKKKFLIWKRTGPGWTPSLHLSHNKRPSEEKHLSSLGSAAKLDSRDRVFGAKRELANDKELETDNKLENYCARAESKRY